MLKFWRKVVPKKVTDLKMNKKLGVDFEDTLKHKISFQTLASESNEVIKDIVTFPEDKIIYLISLKIYCKTQLRNRKSCLVLDNWLTRSSLFKEFIIKLVNR